MPWPATQQHTEVKWRSRLQKKVLPPLHGHHFNPDLKGRLQLVSMHSPSRRRRRLLCIIGLDLGKREEPVNVRSDLWMRVEARLGEVVKKATCESLELRNQGAVCDGGLRAAHEPGRAASLRLEPLGEVAQKLCRSFAMKFSRIRLTVAFPSSVFW